MVVQEEALLFSRITYFAISTVRIAEIRQNNF